MTSWLNDGNSGLRPVPVSVNLEQEVQPSTLALWASTDIGVLSAHI